ncbi:2-oxoacid:acceptor oxidoreductase subunit alpha, partial [Thermoproteota archaeon]
MTLEEHGSHPNALRPTNHVYLVQFPGEKYRNPVIVLSEMTLSLMREKIRIPASGEIEIVNRKRPDVPPEEFLPFEAGEDGVPPM